MNTKLILEAVAAQVKNNKLTYEKFEKIFSFLSKQEQYQALNILYENGIELTDYEEEETEIQILDLDDFLYDEDIFNDDTESGYYSSFDTENIYQNNTNLCILIQKGNVEAKKDLCIKNEKLVLKYAKIYHMYLGNKLDFDDLTQFGYMGLLKAAEKFDARLGYQFSTYAIYWIRQTILRGIFDEGYSIRVPVHTFEKIQKITKLDNDYAVKGYEYKKRVELIAKDLETTADKIEDHLSVRNNIIRPYSLDIPLGEEEDTPFLEIVPFEQDSVETQVSRIHLREALEEVMLELTNREEKVLRLRFGFDDGRIRTLEEVGKEFNVTRERIRQIEAKALRKLKHPSRSKPLRDFLGG